MRVTSHGSLGCSSRGRKDFVSVSSFPFSGERGREDWREGYDSGLKDLQEGIETPEVINNFCKEYLKEINSSFGCFDFIKGIDGNYYFLECNPNGQWLWIEEDIGLSISKEIADYLNG